MQCRYRRTQFAKVRYRRRVTKETTAYKFVPVCNEAAHKLAGMRLETSIRLCRLPPKQFERRLQNQTKKHTWVKRPEQA